MAARRTVFGGCVVHGVHGLVWALECLARGLPTGRSLAALEARFASAIRPGDPVQCRLVHDDNASFGVTIERRGAVVTRIMGRWGGGSYPAVALPGAPSRHECRERRFDEAATAHGSIQLWLDADRAARMFPAWCLRLPRTQLAVLLALTRLVGTECPGLHSLLHGMTLRFGRPATGLAVAWRVARADSRFSSLRLSVDGAGVSGSVAAFLRPGALSQPAFADIARNADPAEFSNHRVLIIGGSRGLGEAAAKLAAARGAPVCVTYASGAEDAQRVRDEIRAGGGDCVTARWDVTSDESPDLAWPPSVVCYFATPRIAVDNAVAFSEESFNRFVLYYVTAFCRVVAHLMDLRAGPLRVLYPSTQFLDETVPGLAEYCAAKAAGEVVCRSLGRRFPALRIVTPWLPRVATDQTASVMHSRMTAAEDALLPVLRDLCRMTESDGSGGDPLRPLIHSR